MMADHGKLAENLGQGWRQRTLAISARKYSDKGYTDLDRRQEPGRVFGKYERILRPFPPIVDKFMQARPPRRNDRQFGHDKKAVDGDEDDEYEDLRPGHRE